MIVVAQRHTVRVCTDVHHAYQTRALLASVSGCDSCEMQPSNQPWASIMVRGQGSPAGNTFSLSRDDRAPAWRQVLTGRALLALVPWSSQGSSSAATIFWNSCTVDSTVTTSVPYLARVTVIRMHIRTCDTKHVIYYRGHSHSRISIIAP